jgi:hypothetical protein
MSYGFAIPGNEQDYVTVSVSLRGDDPHASLRRLVLRAAGLRHPHTAHMCMDSGTALATAAAAPTPTPTPQHGNGARALLSAVDRAVSLCRRSGDVDDESFKAVAFHLRGDCEPLELFAAVCVGVMPASKLRMLLDAWLRDGGGSDGPSARVGDSDADMGGVAGEGACFRHMILHSDALINTRVRACDALHGLLSGKAAAVQAAADRLDAEVAPAPADVDADADGDDAVAAVRLNLSKLYVSSQLYILNAVLRTVVSMRQTFTSSQRRRAVDRYPGASAAVSFDDVMPGGALQLVCGASGAAVVTSRDLEPGAVASTSHAGDVLCPSTLSMVCPRLALALDTVSDLSDTHVVALGVLYLCRALDDVTAEDTESGDRPSSAWTTLAAWLRGCDVTVGVDASRQRSKRRRGGGSDDVSSAGHRWPSCGLPMPRYGCRTALRCAAGVAVLGVGVAVIAERCPRMTASRAGMVRRTGRRRVAAPAATLWRRGGRLTERPSMRLWRRCVTNPQSCSVMGYVHALRHRRAARSHCDRDARRRCAVDVVGAVSVGHARRSLPRDFFASALPW